MSLYDRVFLTEASEESKQLSALAHAHGLSSGMDHEDEEGNFHPTFHITGHEGHRQPRVNAFKKALTSSGLGHVIDHMFDPDTGDEDDYAPGHDTLAVRIGKRGRHASPRQISG